MRFSFRRDDEPIELVNTMCDAGPERCRWGCGSQCAHPAPNESGNEYFGDILERFVSRRSLLKGGAMATGMLAIGASPLLRSATVSAAEGEVFEEAAQAGTTGITFTPIKLSTADQIEVPAGYKWRTLIRWGDPLTMTTNAFNHGKNTAADQLEQFGYNCDYVGFFPLLANRPDRGVLVVNNEYTNPNLMFQGYDAANPTKQQVDVELAAHGVSIVFVQRDATKGWVYVPGAASNRRITPLNSTVLLGGPVAQHPWVRTTEDPHGFYVKGTLNNCSAGMTLWGTVLTCEENFNQYFANNDSVTDPRKKAAHTRYGLTAKASERKWERFYDRFDLAKEPNEPFRFGYVVEIDPHNPTWAPRKHTALGRFKHEAASCALTADGRVAVYMGDDERFDYMYKFITEGKYNANDREANMELLDRGTLYVAKFKDDGSGDWIPLVYGQGKLTPENGFNSQAEICMLTRLAGDAVGATKMDRPEDFEVNPLTGKVYCALTNNTQRGTTGRAAADAANPRAVNTHGHIIELTTTNSDHGALSFKWEIPIQCGIPGTDAGTYYGGYDQAKVSPLSSPDNLAFDNKGNLWVSTDGQINTLRKNDGVFVIPMSGPERGYARQLVSGVPGGETASLHFDDSNKHLFVSIQHPGEDSTFENPTSKFPDGTTPRPSVIVVWKEDGGVIGS